VTKLIKSSVLLVSLALVAGTLVGCSATPKATATADASKVDAAAAALLPDSARKNGLSVGSEIPYAPMEFYDANHKPAGFEVDLVAAIAAKLGIQIRFEEQSFDAIIPALQAGKHDLAVSSMSDTLDRQKVLDFVDYFQGGASLIVNKGNPKQITGLSGLCGQKVAAEAASWEIDVLASASADCKAANKQPIITVAAPSDSDAQTALRAGNVAAYLSDSQAAAYAAKIAGAGKYFDLLVDKKFPTGYESGLIGVGILKSNTKVRDAVAAALKSLFADGTYQSLLAKWNLTSFAVTSPTINGTK
jgi:polar amino acid transport system substrate-binding protein